MEEVRRTHKILHSQRGFTVPEVLATIIIMGIIFAIASSSWQGVVESRRVDSAVNQLVADLRGAHTAATNRLAPQTVEFDTGTRNYRVGPTGTLSPRTLPDGTHLTTSLTSVEFRADGAASSSGTVTVSSDNGAPSYTITITGATSNIRVA
jgi:prepilin-type N-terminal cleavage/methylation domain-containing protein